MEFSHLERSSHPRDRVFRAHRDEFEAVVTALDDVRRVDLQSRAEHAGGRLEQVHRWQGSPSALPVLVRPFVSEDLLVWRQTTLWDPATWRAEWSIEVPGLGPAMECRGINAYEEATPGSTIRVTGSFVFLPQRAAQLQSVPASAVPMVERMVVSLILPLIQRSGKAVSDYLHRS